MEVWKDIPGYEGFYKVSNIGRVKSLKRTIYRPQGKLSLKEKILKQRLSTTGYYFVSLYSNTINKIYKVHQLVAMAFLNHTPCGFKIVVNHKDFNKVNNNVSNLETVTNRENSNKKHLKSKSKYVGVCYDQNPNRKKKWKSSIRINSKKVFLGYFDSEYEAHLAYEKKLKTIT